VQKTLTNHYGIIYYC